MKYKIVSIVLILVLGIFLLIEVNTNKGVSITDIEMQLNDLQKEKRQLLLQIDELKNELKIRDEKASNPTNIKEDTIKYYVLDETKYHGYGASLVNTVVRLLPNSESSVISKIRANDTFEIISEVNAEGDNWLLIRDPSKNMYGYVVNANIELVNIKLYLQPSEWDFSGIHLGDPFIKAIDIFGNDYILKYIYEYRNIYIASFNVDKNAETEFHYDPVSKVINRLRTVDPRIKVNDFISVGENIQDVISKIDIDIEYTLNKKNRELILEDSVGYSLVIYFDESELISAIIYRINKFDV
ncbi:hypothetical protein [Vallitalea guaymasensis]|uniref:hypothetical protein n=1 Tax=Vallitalea guaymasensis TaxID=1185412 RepID=UPI00235799E4|nr:hypothetical protein [Vallitalea guaymasensis]